MIKAVFIDIDDTLLNSERKVTENTKKEIEQCINNGIKIILASGRSRKEAIKIQEEIGTSPLIISSNGASVYDKEKSKEIYNENLDKKAIMTLIDYSEENGYRIKLNYKDKVVVNKAFYEDERQLVRSVSELKEIAQNENVVQCVIADVDFEKMKNLVKYITEKHLELRIVNESKRLKNPELPASKSYYCDIASKYVSKGNAIKEICKYLNIEYKSTIAIGDGENDISMFEQTPNSVAMGNAVEKAKEKAKYMTDTNDNDGVAKVLSEII